jgi:hypothetical protein
MAPRFFGYEQDVRREIERRGAIVDWLPDRPFDTPLFTALTRLKPQWILPHADRLYERLLAQFGASHYDFILIINGQTLSRRTLTLLRASFPTAKLVLYMWDSIENRRGAVEKLPQFDVIFSFDPISARHYGMRLRPLFFSKGVERPAAPSFDYHVSFIGTMHADRYAVIEQLRRNLDPGLRTYWYLYLQAPWVYYAYRAAKPAMRRARRDEFRFVPLDRATVQSVFSRSRAVIDIEHPRQRGLTIRTFDVIGAHKKLITTNAHVRDYDFFRSENICVINRDQPSVPVSFLESSFVPLSAALYHRYSIEGWVDEVLELEPSSQVLVSNL